jgi:putative membrane protein
LRRHPTLAWSSFGAMLVPSLYALIMLSSIWDPGARTAQLPVALVNQDIGVHYGTQDLNLGDEVLQALRTKGLFGYQDFRSAEDARRAVRDGRVAFAVLLPAEFSRQALLGAEPGAGRITLYLSEGNNYAAAGLGKRFAPELAHHVNEMLNERRWTLVLDSTAGSRRDLGSLRLAVDRLVEGADAAASAAHRADNGNLALRDGLGRAQEAGRHLQLATAQLADSAAQFGGGLRRLGAGLQAIDAHAAPERDLRALQLGGRALALGHTELGAGLQQLQAGGGMLREGALALQLEAGEILFVGEPIAQAAGALRDGAEQVEQGLGAARGAQLRLADGTQRFVDGSELLAAGLQRQSAAISRLSAQWPDDARTERFVAGAAETAAGSVALAGGLRQLNDGQARLQEGLLQLDAGAAELASAMRLLKASLPAAEHSQEGTAQGLAQSVRPVLEVVAPVASEGAGLSPNFVPLALWMGAVMTAFLFHFRRLPAHLLAAPRVATVIGRLAVPAILVAGQALVMLAMLVAMLHVPMSGLLPVAATLLAASLLFLCLIFALVHLFGDVGKLIAVLMLVVQMSAAGALLPVELTAPLFQLMHQWLPLSWVVRAFRASLFGAYDGAWATAWAAMLGTAVTAIALAVVFGRWRPVPAEAYRPTMEVD